MNFIERWAIKRITWIKPLEDLTLQELFKLQQDVGKAIQKKMDAGQG
jgi:hypothetical protein